MKAAVLTKFAQPLQILENISVPNLLPGQVLVKIAYSGVCHSQLMEVRGLRGEDKFIPHLLGHEATGIVEDIGSEITKFCKGDRVILGWIKGTGKDIPAAKYSLGDQIINSGGVTTFSEYSVVSENRCYHLPGDIPMNIGVLFGCAVPTGGGIILHEINPPLNSDIAVIGLGGIGLSALMTASVYQNRRLIAIDVSDEKLELAMAIGATHVINSNRENVLNTILQITENRGVDFCVEASGNARVIELGFEIIRRNGGKLVFASHPKAGDKISIDPFELINGKSIKGSWGGMSKPDEDIPIFADFYRSGKLKLSKLISKVYSLEQINEALSDLEHKRVNRPLIAIHPQLA
jgi:S-(hydroxymethyl)glutathione dehydrogenase / alcohol dehydrogenase